MTSSTATVQVLAAPEYRGRVLAIQAIVFLGQHADRRPDGRLAVRCAGPRAAIVAGGLACLVAAAYGARALSVPMRRRPTGPIVVDDAVTLAD